MWRLADTASATRAQRLAPRSRSAHFFSSGLFAIMAGVIQVVPLLPCPPGTDEAIHFQTLTDTGEVIIRPSPSFLSTLVDVPSAPAPTGDPDRVFHIRHLILFGAHCAIISDEEYNNVARTVLSMPSLQYIARCLSRFASEPVPLVPDGSKLATLLAAAAASSWQMSQQGDTTFTVMSADIWNFRRRGDPVVHGLPAVPPVPFPPGLVGTCTAPLTSLVDASRRAPAWGLLLWTVYPSISHEAREDPDRSPLVHISAALRDTFHPPGSFYHLSSEVVQTRSCFAKLANCIPPLCFLPFSDNEQMRAVVAERWATWSNTSKRSAIVHEALPEVIASGFFPWLAQLHIGLPATSVYQSMPRLRAHFLGGKATIPAAEEIPEIERALAKRKTAVQETHGGSYEARLARVTAQPAAISARGTGGGHESASEAARSQVAAVESHTSEYQACLSELVKYEATKSGEQLHLSAIKTMFHYRAALFIRWLFGKSASGWALPPFLLKHVACRLALPTFFRVSMQWSAARSGPDPALAHIKFRPGLAEQALKSVDSLHTYMAVFDAIVAERGLDLPQVVGVMRFLDERWQRVLREYGIRLTALAGHAESGKFSYAWMLDRVVEVMGEFGSNPVAARDVTKYLVTFVEECHTAHDAAMLAFLAGSEYPSTWASSCEPEQRLATSLKAIGAFADWAHTIPNAGRALRDVFALADHYRGRTSAASAAIVPPLQPQRESSFTPASALLLPPPLEGAHPHDAPAGAGKGQALPHYLAPKAMRQELLGSHASQIWRHGPWFAHSTSSREVFNEFELERANPGRNHVVMTSRRTHPESMSDAHIVGTPAQRTASSDVTNPALTATAGYTCLPNVHVFSLPQGVTPKVWVESQPVAVASLVKEDDNRGSQRARGSELQSRSPSRSPARGRSRSPSPRSPDPQRRRPETSRSRSPTRNAALVRRPVQSMRGRSPSPSALAVPTPEADAQPLPPPPSSLLAGAQRPQSPRTGLPVDTRVTRGQAGRRSSDRAASAPPGQHF